MTCSSNSNMGSIVKAMKDALEATGYSEWRNYQRKTIEAYMSGRDVFVSAPTVAGKGLTRVLSKWHLIQDQLLLREIYNKSPIVSYKRAKWLGDILVRAKLFKVMHHTITSLWVVFCLSTPSISA